MQKELFIPEGAHETITIRGNLPPESSYVITVHVAKNASLAVEELIETSIPCTVRFTALLEGEGASLIDKSRYRGHGDALLDMERVVVHKAPGTSSEVDARGVMDDKARALWRGRIVVERAAKKARAFLRHDAMLASYDAFVDAAPFLEIFTDDVSCKHSASVRRIQPELLFYMKSRGVLEEDARNMLLEGFLL